jgi:hypothetical protein
MKYLMFAILFSMVSCKNTNKSPMNQEDIMNEAALSSSLVDIDSIIKSFEIKFEIISNELNDSVSRFKSDGIDFSDLTSGIEAKYNASNNGIEKSLLGYKLAKNYFLCYRNTNTINYFNKASDLFFLFIGFDDGKVASVYLNIDIEIVSYMQKQWGNYSDQEKETLLFYGLLRGFEDGLPEILENANK